MANSILNNNDWDKINDNIKKEIIFGTEWDSLWEGKRPLSTNFFVKTMLYIIPKYIKKEIEKRTNYFLYNDKKIKIPRH